MAINKTVSAAVRLMVTKTALRIIRLDAIQADPSYQRDIQAKHKKIVAEFNEDALGVPLVGERSDGTLWIVDGLQRITALRKLNWVKVRCDVFASAGPEHEAEVFKLVNCNRTKLRPGDIFKALLTGHDPVAWEIKEAVEAEGFKVVTSRGVPGSSSMEDRDLTCVNTLQKMYRDGHGVAGIRFALRTVKACWPGDLKGISSGILAGLAQFYFNMEDDVDEDRCTARLQTTTPQKILYTAGQLSLARNRAGSVAVIIEKLYRSRGDIGKRKAKKAE